LITSLFLANFYHGFTRNMIADVPSSVLPRLKIDAIYLMELLQEADEYHINIWRLSQECSNSRECILLFKLIP